MEFITLSDGRILNLNHVAVIAARANGLKITLAVGPPIFLKKGSKDIETFLNAMRDEGADVDHLRDQFGI
jgi:hypothetical protein